MAEEKDTNPQGHFHSWPAASARELDFKKHDLFKDISRMVISLPTPPRVTVIESIFPVLNFRPVL